MQRRHELHLQRAESAFSEALCVGIMFSRSPRARREHRDEYKGKAAVLAAELIKDHLKTSHLLMLHPDTKELTIVRISGIH